MGKVKDENAVGFLESDRNRKSVSRLGIAITAAVCVLATLIEGGSKLLSVVKMEEVVNADWDAVAKLLGVLLVGTGAIKAAQGFKVSQLKNVNNES